MSGCGRGRGGEGVSRDGGGAGMGNAGVKSGGGNNKNTLQGASLFLAAHGNLRVLLE